VVAAIGARLLPVLLEAGPATRGALHDAEIRLDAAGAPVLAPLGDSPADALAPELAGGAEPSGESALYGLGRILHRLATGRPPRENPGRPGFPPPSAIKPDLPPALDRAIATLLDPDPTVRPTALADLHDVAGPIPDLRRLLATPGGALERPRSRVGEVKLTATTDAPRGGRADAPDVRHLLVVPGDRARALSPSEQSGLAGRLGVPLAAIRARSRDGAPIPVEAGLRASEARQAATREDLPVQVVPPAGLGLPMLALLSAGAGLATGVVALAVALASTLLAVGLGAAAVGLLALTLLPLVLWARRRARHGDAARSHAELLADRAALQAHPTAGPLHRRLTEVRRRLAAADLPAPAEHDLRQALSELEAAVGALAAAPDDPDGSADPEPLTAGLDEVVRLIESASSEGAPGDPSGALERLLDTTRRATDAVRAAEVPGAGAPPRPPPRAREGG